MLLTPMNGNEGTITNKKFSSNYKGKQGRSEKNVIILEEIG